MAAKCAWQLLQNLLRSAADKMRYVNFGVFCPSQAALYIRIELQDPAFGAPTPYCRLQAYPGKYLLMRAQAEFLIQYEGGALLLNNLSAKRITHLKPQGGERLWQDESGNLSIRFALDAKGEVDSLVMESITRFRR